MKKSTLRIILPALAIAFLVLSGFSMPPAGLPATQAQADTPTAFTPPSGGTERPLILIKTYSADDAIRPGSDFNLYLQLTNAGQQNAVNIIITFATGDLIPRGTGGTQTIYQIIPGETKSVTQPMTASSALTPGSVASSTITIEYSEQSSGAPYTASFNASFHISSPNYSGGPARPTATATAQLKPQLVISRYTTNVDPLQPGSRFQLELEVSNLGTSDARSVTMIVGGGAVPSGEGTQVPGSGGTGGDFSTFAPLNSSNLEFIGDIAAGQKINSSKELIVNVTANPGAYSLKFSFVYNDPKSIRYVDDQVITLLVYSLPMVDVSFYRPPDPFYVGQPGILPLQVYNVGRKQAILGNMRVSAPEGSMVTNDTLLVGVLDPGMYNTLDAQVIPDHAGTLEIPVVINYSDDFNQPRTIEQTLSIDVMEMIIEPPIDGGNSEGQPPIDVPVTSDETFWQKVLRFLKGLIGLDSGVPTQNEVPVDGIPEPEIKPVSPAGPAKG